MNFNPISARWASYTRNRQREPADRGQSSFIHISDDCPRQMEIRFLRAAGPKAVGILMSHCDAV